MFNNYNVLQEIKVILNSSKHDVQDLSFSTQTQGLSTVNKLTQETRQSQHFFDVELDQIFKSLDFDVYLNSVSPDTHQFWPQLEQEFEEINENSPLSDLISMISVKSSSHVFNSDESYDFTTGLLNVDHLEEYGLAESCLNFVRNGIPIEFKAGFQPDKIRHTPNSRSVNRNKLVVAKVVSPLVASGHVSPVTYKPTVISRFNVTP